MEDRKTEPAEEPLKQLCEQTLSAPASNRCDFVAEALSLAASHADFGGSAFCNELSTAFFCADTMTRLLESNAVTDLAYGECMRASESEAGIGESEKKGSAAYCGRFHGMVKEAVGALDIDPLRTCYMLDAKENWRRAANPREQPIIAGSQPGFTPEPAPLAPAGRTVPLPPPPPITREVNPRTPVGTAVRTDPRLADPTLAVAVGATPVASRAGGGGAGDGRAAVVVEPVEKKPSASPQPAVEESKAAPALVRKAVAVSVKPAPSTKFAGAAQPTSLSVAVKPLPVGASVAAAKPMQKASASKKTPAPAVGAPKGASDGSISVTVTKAADGSISVTVPAPPAPAAHPATAPSSPVIKAQGVLSSPPSKGQAAPVRLTLPAAPKQGVVKAVAVKPATVASSAKGKEPVAGAAIEKVAKVSVPASGSAKAAVTMRKKAQSKAAPAALLKVHKVQQQAQGKQQFNGFLSAFVKQ